MIKAPHRFFKVLSLCAGITFWGVAGYGDALCTTARALINGDVSLAEIDGFACNQVHSSDGNDQYFCALEFGFRDESARVAYEDLVRRFQSCFDDAVKEPVGPAVNHPDSFDQTILNVRGNVISVSLKDKGALQKTYVFVRLPAN